MRHRRGSGADGPQSTLCLLAGQDRGQGLLSTRRSALLWGLVLWLLTLAAISVWRGVVLWREAALLFELGSTLTQPALALLVSFSILCGAALTVSTVGLWWRRDWARQVARISIPLYFALVQTYTWVFVRSGLMWARRWAAMSLAILATGIGVGALSWRRSRQWLGLN